MKRRSSEGLNISSRDWEKLSYEDQTMMLAFASYSPSIARLPHCIIRTSDVGTSDVALKSIAKELKVKVGVWSMRPFVDPSGRPYLEPEDGRIIEEFVFWELVENQKYALQASKYGGAEHFLMVIDARTPTDILKRTYEYSDEDDSLSHYNYLDYLCEWINDLGWAYLPLVHEGTYWMFVTSNSRASLLGKVETALLGRAIPVSHLREASDRFYWQEPK